MCVQTRQHVCYLVALQQCFGGGRAQTEGSVEDPETQTMSQFFPTSFTLQGATHLLLHLHVQTRQVACTRTQKKCMTRFTSRRKITLTHYCISISLYWITDWTHLEQVWWIFVDILVCILYHSEAPTPAKTHTKSTQTHNVVNSVML